MLLMLGGEEVGGVVAEQGSIEVDCDFCHSNTCLMKPMSTRCSGRMWSALPKGCPDIPSNNLEQQG
ncbi:Uncharacterised protein [Neisseria gonorrhoeae]|nr:Uncharacterised protein [Neisseria gonorrhoeae]